MRFDFQYQYSYIKPTLVLSDIEDEKLFYFFVEILESKFDAVFSLKAEIMDTKYFDFSLSGFHLTLHYQLYIGIELLPSSMFSKQKASNGELAFIEELGSKLLEEKRGMEELLKEILDERPQNTKSDSETRTKVLNEIADVTKKTVDTNMIEAYFIDKKFEEIVAIIGPPKQFGSMDRGHEVDSWKVRNALLEIWFYNNLCTEVTLKEMNPDKASRHFKKGFFYFFTLFLISWITFKYVPQDNYCGAGCLILWCAVVLFTLGVIYLVLETLYWKFKGNNELVNSNLELLMVLIFVSLLLYLFG